MEFNNEFDASGLACPLPIVKTKKALKDMAAKVAKVAAAGLSVPPMTARPEAFTDLANPHG